MRCFSIPQDLSRLILLHFHEKCPDVFHLLVPSIQTVTVNTRLAMSTELNHSHSLYILLLRSTFNWSSKNRYFVKHTTVCIFFYILPSSILRSIVIHPPCSHNLSTIYFYSDIKQLIYKTFTLIATVTCVTSIYASVRFLI